MLARTETDEIDGLRDVCIFMSPKYMKWRGRATPCIKLFRLLREKKKGKAKEAAYINIHSFM